MIIIENVLRTPKEYIFEIEHFLKSIGYHVLVTFQKNLSQFGAFQIRQRLFIIAIKSENINGEFTKPYSPTYQPNKIPISCVLDSPYADPFVRPNENIIKKAIDLDYSKWSSTSNTSGYGNLFLINPKLTYTHALTNISKNYYLLKFYINN